MLKIMSDPAFAPSHMGERTDVNVHFLVINLQFVHERGYARPRIVYHGLCLKVCGGNILNHQLSDEFMVFWILAVTLAPQFSIPIKVRSSPALRSPACNGIAISTVWQVRLVISVR